MDYQADIERRVARLRARAPDPHTEMIAVNLFYHVLAHEEQKLLRNLAKSLAIPARLLDPPMSTRDSGQNF